MFKLDTNISSGSMFTWRRLSKKTPTEVGREYLIYFEGGGYVVAQWRDDSALHGFGYDDGDYYRTSEGAESRCYWTELPIVESDRKYILLEDACDWLKKAGCTDANGCDCWYNFREAMEELIWKQTN